MLKKKRKKEKELQFCSLWNKTHIHRKIDKMKRQRAMYQMKEHDKTPEKQLNEVEIGNFPEKEFEIMIVKMIQDLVERMEAKNWEDARKVLQRYRRIKEQTNRVEQHNNWN